MPANTIDVVKTLTVQGRTVGLDRMAADLKAVASGQEQVASSAAKLVSATSTVERGTLSAQRQLDNLTKSMDPLTNAMAKLERIQRAAGSVQAQGGIVSEANSRAIANARARVDELREAVEKHTNSMSLNRMQQLEAVHVAKSFVDQVIAGQSPLRALAVEGGRIGQIFASGSGGVGGTLKAVGSSLGGLVTGWMGLGTAAVAASGLAYAAAVSFVGGQDKMAASLEGTGRAAGLTFGQLNGIALAGAAASGRLSISNAQSAAGTFAHSGIGGAVNQGLVGSLPDYARVSGAGLDEAAKTLAQAFADPEKGAATLNQQLGFLNDRVMTQIHTQEASGNIEAARATLLTAYNASLSEVTDRTWLLSRAFESVKVDASNAFERLGKDVAGLFGHRDPADQLRSLQTQQGLLPANDAFNRQRLQAEIDALTQQMGRQDARDRARADQAKRETDANTLALQAREVIRGILPEIERNETFATRSGILQRAVANPTGLDNPADASRALGMLTTQHAFSDPFTVMRQDAQLALDAVNATTLAERAVVEARRAELAVLRETGDTAKASAAAQDSLNLAMAKARSDAEDRLTSSKQELAMVGMTPFQRSLRELDNQYKGPGGIFEKDAATGSQLTAALQPVQADLRAAGDTLAQTLREAAEKVRGAVSGGTIPGSVPTLPSGSFTNGNAAYVLKALVANGYNPQAAAGFVGGLTGESGTGLNTSALNPKSGAFGAMQALGDRKNALLSMYDPTSIETQTKFILQELQGPEARAGRVLRSATSVQGGLAANVAYERPSAREVASSYDQRLANGNALAGGRTFAPSASSVTDAAATLSADQGAYGNKRQAIIGNAFDAPLRSANEALDQQIKLLDVQQATMGKSASEIQAAAKAQELWNTYTAMDPNREAGSAVWQKLSVGIEDYRTKMQGVLDKQAELNAQSQRTIGTMDGIRDASKGALSTFVNDLRNGQSAGKALQDVMGGLTDKILNLAEDQAIKGLFGASGTTGGGVLSSLIGAFIHHEGGMVGRDGRLGIYPAAMFAGAPRYHSGMGLRADERPAILQTGEAVLSRADLAAARAQKSQAQAVAPAGVAGSNAPPVIHIHTESGTQVGDVKTSRGPGGEHVIEAMVVNTMLKDLGSNGKFSRALKSFSGAGRTGG